MPTSTRGEIRHAMHLPQSLLLAVLNEQVESDTVCKTVADLVYLTPLLGAEETGNLTNMHFLPSNHRHCGRWAMSH